MREAMRASGKDLPARQDRISFDTSAAQSSAGTLFLVVGDDELRADDLRRAALSAHDGGNSELTAGSDQVGDPRVDRGHREILTGNDRYEW